MAASNGSSEQKPGMLLNIFLFFCLHPAACGILIAWPEIEPVPPALEGRVLTTRSGRRSPLGHIPQCTGQPPTTKNDLVPNVSGSKAKKSWPRGLRSSCVLLTYNDCHVGFTESVSVNFISDLRTSLTWWEEGSHENVKMWTNPCLPDTSQSRAFHSSLMGFWTCLSTWYQTYFCVASCRENSQLTDYIS